MSKDESLAAGAETWRSRWIWPLAAVAFAMLGVSGGFSLSHIFYTRDLSLQYWPAHLWLRKTLLSGESPFWDPFIAFGQPAINDPTRQILFLPTLPLRLLLPDVVGYNLSISLAVPLAALGAYLFLRRTVSPQSAALGAVVFAVSGPVLASANFVNLVWAAACIPWILWSSDRLVVIATSGRAAILAGLFALQATAGEPVTLVATALLALSHAARGSSASAGESRVGRLKGVGLTIGSGLLGGLLAAPQLLPLLESARASFRNSRAFAESAVNPSLHPLTALEAVAPNLFVDSLAPLAQPEPWMKALNGGLAPFFVSIYVGIGALSLALLGALAAASRHRSYFWVAVFAAAVLCALGDHTPFYPLLAWLIPPLSGLRFPPKYLLVAVMAVAALAAAGFDEVARAQDVQRRRFARAAMLLSLMVAVTAGLGWVLVRAFPGSAAEMFAHLAASTGQPRPDLGALYLAQSVDRIAPGLLFLSASIAGCLRLALAAGRMSIYGRAGLFLIVAIDPLVKNIGVNPTIDAAQLREPGWSGVVRAHPSDRVYVGGRLSFILGNADMDDPAELSDVNPKASRALVETIRRARLGAHIPGAWGMREAVSADMTLQWPTDYWDMLLVFKRSPAEARVRYLGRVGVRYFLQPRAVEGAKLVLESKELGSLKVYDQDPIPRASIVSRFSIEPSLRAQTERLFGSDVDPREVVLLHEPPPAPAGDAGPAMPSRAEIIEDGAVTVEVRAAVPEAGGYLVLTDTFDPNWSVDVDGRAGRLLRANGLFRAVHLTAGEHRVRFAYSSRPFGRGVVLAAIAALLLIAIRFWEARRLPKV
jgi:hypothetical protein